MYLIQYKYITEMDYYLKSITLIILFCALVGFSGGEPQLSWDGDPRYDLSWVEFHQKLYAVDREVLDPIETLDLLKILEEKYKIRRDEESIEKYKKIRGLLHIAELSDEKCEHTIETFNIMNEQFNLNKQYPNIVAFLDQCRDAQYIICEKVLIERLEDDVKQLPQWYEQNLEELKASMVVASIFDPIKKQVFRTSNPVLLMQGIAHFLERKLFPFATKVVNAGDGVTVYIDKFNDLIKKPCYDITENLRIQEVKTMEKDERSLEKLNTFARKWLEDFNLCLSIMNNSDHINQLRSSSLLMLLNKNQEARIRKEEVNLPPLKIKEPKRKTTSSSWSCFGCKPSTIE